MPSNCSSTVTGMVCGVPTFRLVSTPEWPAQRLGDQFPGVTFGLLPGVPDADAQSGTGTDGVRIGTARILTMSPDGSSSSGTLYVRGRRTHMRSRDPGRQAGRGSFTTIRGNGSG